MILTSAINDDKKKPTFSIKQRECSDGDKRGTCMFHYECQSQRGNVLKTCIDGFLFGVCCEIKAGKEDEKEEAAAADKTTTER